MANLLYCPQAGWPDRPLVVVTDRNVGVLEGPITLGARVLGEERVAALAAVHVFGFPPTEVVENLPDLRWWAALLALEHQRKVEGRASFSRGSQSLCEEAWKYASRTGSPLEIELKPLEDLVDPNQLDQAAQVAELDLSAAIRAQAGIQSRDLEILIRCRVQRQSLREIGEELHLSPTAVRKIVKRTESRLREHPILAELLPGS